MEKVYGYVLLPVAFTPQSNDEELEPTVAVERLWHAGQFDLDGEVEHFHEDGGFAPKFVEAGSEPEAIQALIRQAT